MRSNFKTVFCLVALSVSALASPPILKQDFETDAAGWTAPNAASPQVRVTHEAGSAKNGKGALAIEYDAPIENPAVALLPVARSLQGMKSIRLWMKAQSATAAGISLNEGQGGRYLAVVWLEPNVWQRVELTPEDFILGETAGDPADPDGKLDLDQVRMIAIVDVSQVIGAALSHGKSPVMVTARQGPQKMFVDDFEVSAETPAWFKPREAFTIDGFSHPQLDWFTLGGAALTLDTSGKVITGNALHAEYKQSEDRFVLIVHALPAMRLNGATHLTFDIASDKEAVLVVSLQQELPGKLEGPRYNVRLQVTGGGKAAHRQVAFSAFERSQNGPEDPEGKLDLDKLKSIGFLDITGAINQSSATNAIWIGNVAAVKTTALPQ